MVYCPCCLSGQAYYTPQSFAGKVVFQEGVRYVLVSPGSGWWPDLGSPELAGYDVRLVPMASLCASLSVDWPLEVAWNHVSRL